MDPVAHLQPCSRPAAGDERRRGRDGITNAAPAARPTWVDPVTSAASGHARARNSLVAPRRAIGYPASTDCARSSAG